MPRVYFFSQILKCQRYQTSMIVYERWVKFTLSDNLCQRLMSQEILNLKKYLN